MITPAFADQIPDLSASQNLLVALPGVAETADDPLAITAIQSAAAFSTDQQIKYHLVKTEGTGRQVCGTCIVCIVNTDHQIG